MSDRDKTTELGRWMEEYPCGCSNVTKSKAERLGYCPIHGVDAIRIYRLLEAVKAGLSD